MKQNHFRHLLSVIIAIPFVAGISAGSGAQNRDKSAFTVEDCIKCHAGPPADIASAGAAHQKLTCFDCHPGHRPNTQNNIPSCNQCHTGKPHYDVKGCLDCHKNPHTPLKVSFGYTITSPCLTCHTTQIKQLEENRSKHTNLFCTSCHNVHRVLPLCVQCHKPHAADMTQADCTKCHQAHMPGLVTFGKDTPNKECAICHPSFASILSSGKTKHSRLSCVTCHAGKHRTIPTCQSCHGERHASVAAMMERFANCGDCHFTAHDLNNWPEDAKNSPSKEILQEMPETK